MEVAALVLNVVVLLLLVLWVNARERAKQKLPPGEGLFGLRDRAFTREGAKREAARREEERREKERRALGQPARRGPRDREPRP